MTLRNYPKDILNQATDVLTAYKQIDPDLKVGTLSQADFADAVARTRTIQAQITILELQLLDLRNKCDDELLGLWDTVKRARATVKGAYGDDSSQYEMVGGTRMSDRKRTARKQPA